MSDFSWELVGFLAGAITTLGYLPQIMCIWKLKRTDGVSPFAFVTLASGVALWFIYGLRVKAWPVVAANGVTFVFLCIILFLTIKYKRNNEIRSRS